MKRFQLVKKKLLPLFLCIAVAGSQTPVMAAEFDDNAVVSEAEDGFSGSISDASESDQNTEDSTENSGSAEKNSDAVQSGNTENVEELTPEEDTQGESSEEAGTASAQDELFGDGEKDSDSESSGVDYIKGRPLTEEEKEEQLAPFDTLTTYSTAEEIGNDTDEIPMGRAAAYPSYYNSAEQGYVTSVKDQEPYGMCWAFGMASLLETSLLTQGLGAYDLSEEHLAYFFANRQNDPLGNTAGDINHHYGTDDNGNVDYHEGGNDLLASMFLSTWSGMTTEADVPLATDSTHTLKTGVTPAASKAYDAVAYLKNAYFSDYSVSALKKMLVASQAVTIMYNAQNTYYNADTAAYSYPVQTKSVNHVVTVVGWDDNYSAANFKAASKVTSDGAWIVKNSWGADWGKDGYFYLSYEDGSISSLVSATAVSKPEYPNNYFYDGTSGLAYALMYSGEKFSTVFRANAGNGKAESLGEITLAGKTEGAVYSVQVYTNLKNVSDPTSGTPAYTTPVTCTQSMAGIMTFKIPEVLISQNSLYSVVVTNAGNEAVEYYAEANVNYNWCRFEASIKTGQSFVWYPDDQKWKDATKFNPAITPRIKAHTRTLESEAKLQLSDTSLNLYCGEKKSLSVSATRSDMTAAGITWKSSDTGVASVSATGEITAKAPGSATITCYGNNAKGIQASCKVTVRLKQTTGAKISSRAFNQITVSWTGVSGCNRYEIYRSANNGKKTRVASVGSGTKNWKDTSVKLGSTYQYQIRAAYVKSGKTTVYGAFSSAVTAKPELGKVSVAVTPASGPVNKLSWKKVSGASGYLIYRRVQGKGWQKIKDVNSKTLSYRDSGIQGITSYAYAVKAYRSVNGKKIAGSYTPGKYVLSYPAKQKISKVQKTSRGLKVCWNVQKKADCYIVYRKTKSTSWKKIATVSGGKRSSYEDKTAKKGVTYYYAVRAGARTSTGKMLYGSYVAKTAKR